MAISRRDALKFSGLMALSVSAGECSTTQKQHELKAKAPLPKTKKPRVVVVGGGWSGLSVAKYTKLYAKECEVILVEQRYEFLSCPMSNLWLVDRVKLEYLTHDYLQGAREHNYTYFHATAIGVDKKNNILKTTNGDIEYDHLVLAPGIDYDYSYWNVNLNIERRLRQEYPAAFIPGSEHITLKNKIHNFKGGNFILSVPAGNYRCLPAPYERACIIADFFKTKKLDAKVILLDENNDITIKEHGFHTAFNKLYKNYIDYRPNSKIENIDLDTKTVETEFEEFSFDDASFYPHVRGGKILETMGVAKDTIYNKMEGDIDPITYEVNGHKNIYISGDARPMGFSKSGNTSNTEGQYVAKLIATKINKASNIKWQSPLTICFSAVSINPERAIYIHSEYAYNKQTKRFGFATPVSSENWGGKDGLDNAKGLYDWADALYVDMFGKTN
ncbi:MAG: FAD-dependent oxidoreductase [Epsilonproteobacteria bacterium]|nr:FAD-dependent oxidoreductase [Campylobacterota bacterium]